MTTWTKQSRVSLGSSNILEDMNGLGLEFMDSSSFEDMTSAGISWSKTSRTSSVWSNSSRTSLSWTKKDRS